MGEPGHHEVSCVMHGAMTAGSFLERQVDRRELGDNVRCIGYLNRHTKLNKCYSAADIFILSSRTETKGLALLEPMAQDVPVVSTAQLGTHDIAREGAGVWIAEEDTGDFCGKVSSDCYLKNRGVGGARPRTCLVCHATSEQGAELL